ncbi:MAG: CehA/McbA family metallohydrolase [Anaerolineae bacterium]|nr:CehA/McbA family metallohydrolase [Anaerolineae bacterium]
METYREYAGNLHMHSVYSDGAGTYHEIALAAREAGLDFIVITDHNVHPEGLEGYYGKTLVLTGEEIHNVRRTPQANHLLVYNTERELTPYAFGSPQTLIDKVKEGGGFCYIAHPVERSSPLGPDYAAIPWVDWPVEGIRGLEIWNYMSEFKGLLWSYLPALVYSFLPSTGIKGPYKATLRLWDELLAKGYRLSALGNADAHSGTYKLGPFKRTLFPYSYLFRCVNTHVLTQAPLTGDVEADKVILYEALMNGRTWVAYDLPHTTRGFRFFIRSGSAKATMGEELKRLGALTVEIELPARGEIRLLRDGKVIKREHGMQLEYTSVEPGVYRVEVYRNFRGRRIGWIFTSPLYVI